MRVSKKNAGQILPLILFVLTVSSVLMVVMFNTGQKTVDKSIATNAADAGAYSAGVWVSRNLNYLAYTNRAMVANHVAVGHLITYVSWIRYVADTVAEIHKITRFIPYVGQVTEAIDRAVTEYKGVTEFTANFTVPGVDELNRLIYASQLAAVTDLRPGVVNQVMADVVRTYDPQLDVNEPDSLRGRGLILFLWYRRHCCHRGCTGGSCNGDGSR
ncbi:hypothetical protein [Aliamphritea spongicola]|nr:hypothetical protein [Aliamphritea spongicola]